MDWEDGGVKRSRQSRWLWVYPNAEEVNEQSELTVPMAFNFAVLNNYLSSYLPNFQNKYN
jgi:hypothetical protein